MANNLSLTETQSLKEQLEKEMFILITKFKEKTTMTVSDVNLTHTYSGCGNMDVISIDVEVKL